MAGWKNDLKSGNVPDDVIDLDLCSSSPGTPLRPICCVKNPEKMREVEKKEDCFILDFDPENPWLVSNLPDDFDKMDDISVVSEKGQVACRDYPHSRHVCFKYPFEKTAHESYCPLCYCLVCDVAAPCNKWAGALGHCHAINTEAWMHLRETTRMFVNKP